MSSFLVIFLMENWNFPYAYKIPGYRSFGIWRDLNDGDFFFVLGEFSRRVIRILYTFESFFFGLLIRINTLLYNVPISAREMKEYIWKNTLSIFNIKWRF